MQKSWIKNFKELATSKNRELALDIVEAGLNALNTEEVMLSSIKLENNILFIQNQSFPLEKYKKIKVVGFGKASCTAAIALEKILGDKIKEGAVIGLSKTTCSYIETFSGTHPVPSALNVKAGEKIYQIIKDSNEDDLIIVLVSGGGSALLCHSLKECEQHVSLYNEFLKHGKTIDEINTVRKHLSILKGGGLAKIAYPATVIGLVFSDIPGDHFENVASGPTFKDKSTMLDAENIIKKYDLGVYDLIETPKEDKYFEKVHNFILVSNKIAVEAMGRKSQELGFKIDIVSTELYDLIDESLEKILTKKEENTVILAAGEPKVEVKNFEGRGGRNMHMGLSLVAKSIIDSDSVFISFASDGQDNSDGAGAIVDRYTIDKIEKLNLNVEDYLKRFDSYSIFEKSGDIIMTGPTGANVSDLMILLTKK